MSILPFFSCVRCIQCFYYQLVQYSSLVVTHSWSHSVWVTCRHAYDLTYMYEKCNVELLMSMLLLSKVRPPQPSVFYFVIDVSYSAVQSGESYVYLSTCILVYEAPSYPSRYPRCDLSLVTRPPTQAARWWPYHGGVPDRRQLYAFLQSQGDTATNRLNQKSQAFEVASNQPAKRLIFIIHM